MLSFLKSIMAKELNAKIQSKIVEYLEKRTEQSSITEISRDLDIGRNTVAKYLELLKFQGLVEQRSIGQAKLWSLTDTPFNSEKYGISIRDKKGRHIYSYGAKALSKFGFNEDTFQGKTTSEALGEDYSDVDSKAFESIKTMQPTVSHKIYKTNKHSSKVTQYFFPNFNDSNKVIGAISIAVVSDIK